MTPVWHERKPKAAQKTAAYSSTVGKGRGLNQNNGGIWCRTCVSFGSHFAHACSSTSLRKCPTMTSNAAPRRTGPGAADCGCALLGLFDCIMMLHMYSGKKRALQSGVRIMSCYLRANREHDHPVL